MAGSDEYHIQTTPTQTTDIPAQFTDCHSHGSELYATLVIPPSMELKLTRFCLAFVLALTVRMSPLSTNLPAVARRSTIMVVKMNTITVARMSMTTALKRKSHLAARTATFTLVLSELPW